MAAGTLPAPGTKFGPCTTPCAHVDCAATLRQAAALCRYCEKPIGFDTRFYELRDRAAAVGVPAEIHASCHEELAAAGLLPPS